MRRNIGPLLPEIYHINYPDMLRSKYGKDENKAIEILDGAIKDYLDGKIGDEVFEYAKGW